MAKAKQSVVSTDKHSLRLIQQVPPGTPGAFVDPIFGSSWLATPRAGPKQGLNGSSGFISVENNPIINDAGEFTATLPPVGSDGRDNRDRFYYYSDTPDPQNPSGPTVGYMPGDEWIEVHRGTNELVATGTPVSDTADPSQIQMLLRDVQEVFKKNRETASGFWNHSARDVFEHYTRGWKCLIADDFVNSTSQFTLSGSFQNSPDGHWSYINCDASLGAGFVVLRPPGGASSSFLNGRQVFVDGGATDHSCWRVEADIPYVSAAANGLALALQVLDTTTGAPLAFIEIAPGSLVCETRVTGGTMASWPVNAAGLLDPNGLIEPPYNLAIEARERWVYFYVNGQLVAVGLRLYTSSSNIVVSLQALATTAASIGVASVVARKTTPPMNGGQPGDYQLASAPAAGGLSGQYFDVTNVTGPSGVLEGAIAPPSVSPSAIRNDGGIFFATPAGPAPPAWLPAALGAAEKVYVRWTGSIYLPLATQDVHFAITSSVATWMGEALYVGRTRKGEAVATSGLFAGESAGLTSVGMRSLLGNVSGWYPIVFEYVWIGFAGAHTTGFTYDVGGSGSVPSPEVLSPYGCFTQQVPNGDSHFDTLQTTIAEAFAIQYKTRARSLESGSFPGIVVPKVRVGRDTDYVMDETGAVNPQSTSKAEDLATTVLGQAQGLGGNSSGSLLAEAFNFPVMASHPFVLTESENLPSTSQMNMLILQLATLLGLRSEVWQEITADSIGQRQMQDSWPLTGTLLEFDWGIGDGLRVNLPKIGVVDVTPRQIVALKRMLYPDGMGANTASFRARPRDFNHVIRKFIRSVYASRRAFQGQLTWQPGSRAVAPAISETILPPDLSYVRQAQLVILSKSNTSAWDVNINGVATGQSVTGVGYVDVSNSVARNGATEPRMIATLTGGTGTVAYMLQLLALVSNS